MSLVGAASPLAAAGAATGLRVDVLTEVTDLEALEPCWTALWQRVHGRPFQAPFWLIAWWRCFGRGELRVLTVRQAGQLVAVAPLYREPGPGRARLRLMGAAVSDYLDVLLAPELSVGTAFGLWLEFLASLGEAAEVHLDRLAPDSAIPWVVPPADWAASNGPDEVCPAIRIPAGRSSLEGLVPGAMLSRLRYYRRRLERLGGGVEAANEGNLQELGEGLLRLHRARWSERDGSTGVLADPAVARFHAVVLPTMLRAGLLRMLALRVHGELVGVHYGMQCAGTAYSYIGGFDPEHARLSPGSLLIGHALEAALVERATIFDFLRGGEPYKHRWGATDRQSSRLTLRPRGSIAAR